MTLKYVIEKARQENGCLDLQWSKQGEQKYKELCQDKLELIKCLGLDIGINKARLKNFWRANWCDLKDFNVSNNLIGNAGCKYLSRASIPQLQVLKIHNNNIDRAGFQHLCKASWPELRQVNLSFNHHDAFSMKSLSKSNWKKLQQIQFNYTYDRQLNFASEPAYVLIFQSHLIAIIVCKQMVKLGLSSKSEQKLFYKLIGQKIGNNIKSNRMRQ